MPTNLEKNILLVVSVFVVSTLPARVGLNSSAIIVFAAYGLWLLVKYKSYDKYFLSFFLFSVPFTIVLVIGFFYSTNIRAALKLFETRISLLVFPILFLFLGRLWDERLLRKIFLAFVLTTILCGFIVQGELIVDLWRHGSLSDFFYWKVSGSDLSERIGIHPTYLSMYAIFSIGIIYEFYVAEKTGLKMIPGCLAISYLIVLTLHLSSRISFLILGLALLLLIVHLTSVRKHKVWPIMTLLVVSLGILFSLDKFSIKSRLENNTGFNLGDFMANNAPDSSKSNDQRTFAWYSSVNIMKENVWLGVGSGDVTDSLNARYLRLHMNELAEAQLNSHNQFFDGLIRNGIPGLISLILLYFNGILKAARQRLYWVFLIVIIFTSMTENLLERQKGVVFFAVFSSLLVAYSKKDHPVPIGNSRVI